MSEGAAAEGDVLTAGGMLKAARQASGLHIAALAVALKVPVNKLEALEADNFAVLPDTVFVRALASSVCRTLKVDAGPILALLPQSNSPRLSANSGGLNAPVKSLGGKSSSFASPSTVSGSSSRWVTVLVLALLAGALALVYFPRASDGMTDDAPAVAGTEQLPAVDAAVGSRPAASVEAAPAQLVPGAALSAASEAVAASVPSAASAPVPAAETPSNTGLPAGLLVLRARRDSWVQVRDSAGAVVLQRNLAAGETVAASGAVPLSVVIGRADVTDVFVRGKQFELTAVSRENVARFEVK